MKIPLIFFGTIIVMVQGCSHYEGHKLALDGTIPQETGIPYTLMKPIFTVEQKSQGEQKEPRYEIKVTYLPDPNHRYTLRVDPSWFTDVKFGLKLGMNNELIKTNNSQTDQLVPTIKSIGSFVAQVIGALGVFDKGDIRTEIVSKIDDLDSSLCQTELKNNLKNRINGLKNEKTFKTQFHYLNEPEKACLINSMKNISVIEKADLEDRKKLAEDRIKNFRENHTSEGDKAFIQYQRKALAQNDRKSLEKVMEIFEPIVTEDGTDLNATQLNSVRQQFNLAQTVTPNKNQIENWSSVNSIVLGYVIANQANDASRFLKSVIEIPYSGWRMRHLKYLERCMDEYHFQVLKAVSDPKGCERSKEQLFSEIAKTIDAEEIKERITMLQTFVSTIPEGCVQVGSYTTCTRKMVTDYQVARKELEQAMTEFQAARAKVITAGTIKKKELPRPKLKQQIRAVTQKEFEKLSSNDTKPEWVIVFRRPK